MDHCGWTRRFGESVERVRFRRVRWGCHSAHCGTHTLASGGSDMYETPPCAARCRLAICVALNQRFGTASSRGAVAGRAPGLDCGQPTRKAASAAGRDVLVVAAAAKQHGRRHSVVTDQRHQRHTGSITRCAGCMAGFYRYPRLRHACRDCP